METKSVQQPSQPSFRIELIRTDRAKNYYFENIEWFSAKYMSLHYRTFPKFYRYKSRYTYSTNIQEKLPSEI